MPYTVINSTNSPNRKSRLNKELAVYKEYLESLKKRSHALLENLKNKENLAIKE